jgi:hypothetical protein
MTSPTDEEKCTTCGRTRVWHQENKSRHAFNGKLGQTPMRPQVKAAPWPFDPVLRQALIDKGILTPEDLTAAEAKIRAISGVTQ